MSSTYKIQFPFATAWEETTDKNIDPETVRTWIDFNEKNLTSRQGFLKILSKNSELAVEAYQSLDSIQFHIDFSCELSKDWEFEVRTRKPAIIFFDLESSDDESIPLIEKVIQAANYIEDYSPIIVISNTPSSGQSFQKLFSYSFIFVFPGALTIKMLKALSSAYLKKKESPPLLSLGIDFLQRSMDVYFSPVIHSLSEHMITLSSTCELPYYTVLHLTVPIDYYATIIPEKGLTPKRGDSFIYRCYIHGIDEKQLNRLRQFVNQLIYTPIKDFSAESVEKAMKGNIPPDVSKEATKTSMQEISPPESGEPTKKTSSGWADARLQIKGKTKL